MAGLSTILASYSCRHQRYGSATFCRWWISCRLQTRTGSRFLAATASAAALAPLIFFLYRRRDEMERHLHGQACVAAMALLTALCAMLGVLQACGLLPLFNQFVTLGLLIAVWGLQLALADRRLR